MTKEEIFKAIEEHDYDVLLKLTPDEFKQYEILKKFKENYKDKKLPEGKMASLIVGFFPEWWRNENTDICEEAFRYKKTNFCYLPKEVLEEHPEYISQISHAQWISIARSAKYANMPLEKFEEFECWDTVPSEPGNGFNRISPEIAVAHPKYVIELVKKAIEEENMDFIHNGLPDNVLTQEQLQMVSKRIKDSKEAKDVIKKAEVLKKELDDEISGQMKRIADLQDPKGLFISGGEDEPTI